jgi:hypothetical protein
MYTPAPFLISSAAITSIFSFFFGGYFREREWAYRLWIKYVAYGADLEKTDEFKGFCSELESKERVFRQAKGLLTILLFTLVVEFIIFQFYSMKYIMIDSKFYEPDAFHTYIYFNSIIGIIVFINCLELLYIKVAVIWSSKFPYISFRKRVSGQERLSILWEMVECPEFKHKLYKNNKIPEIFYRDYHSS